MTNYEKVEDLAKQILSTKAGNYTLKQLIELAIKAEKKDEER